MTAFAFKDLGSNVVRSTANCSLFLSVEVEFGSQAEVAQLDFHFFVKEEVSKFEVAVNDSVRVEVLEGAYNLGGVALHFQLVQALTPLKKLVHACVLAKLEQDVDIFAVFKKVLEMANVVVLDTPMNLDLTH